MFTMKAYVRLYVRQNNAITLEEVKNRIINEAKIEATYSSIRTTLYIVRKELGVEPAVTQVSKIILNYVKEHNNCISYEEVKDYIFNEKCIKIKETTIRTILKNVVKESNGKLKRNGLKQVLRDYLTEKTGPVTFEEVKDYVVYKRGITVPDYNLRNTLYMVCKEVGIKIKSTTITEMVRDYCKEHKEKVVTFAEVKAYLLHDRNIEASDSAIKSALRKVSEETGVTVKRNVSITEVIRNYIKETEGQVTIKEMKDYILNKRKLETTPSTIKHVYYKARKEYIANSHKTE